MGFGRLVVWPLPASSERQTSELPVALIRNATLAINTDGQTVKVKGRRLLGSRDAGSGLWLVSNLQASEYCRALTAQAKGWGRIARGTLDTQIRNSRGRSSHRKRPMPMTCMLAADPFSNCRPTNVTSKLCRQLALLTSQQRQAFCLVEMAPPAPCRSRSARSLAVRRGVTRIQSATLLLISPPIPLATRSTHSLDYPLLVLSL